MGAHDKLESGNFDHRCDKCVMVKPPIRHYLDTGLEAIDSHWVCDDSVTQFSVGLMGHHKLLKRLSDIERACSAHANLHVHSWAYLTPLKKLKPRPIRRLDDADQVSKAYDEAMGYIVLGAFERREEWYRRKP